MSHTISTTAPTIMPASEPLYVRRFQNSERITTGPNAAPKSAHAFDTIFITACAPEPLLLAIKNAITETIITTTLPTQRTSFSDAFFLMIGLYISLVNDDDATRSCQSAVDIDAAIIAARSKPAIKPGNTRLASVTNTSSCAPFARSSRPITILP